MNNIDLIGSMFIFYTIFISIGGYIVNFLPEKINYPVIINQAFKFGKMSTKGKKYKLVEVFEIPKRY